MTNNNTTTVRESNHDYGTWDGPYVLGALTLAERRAYQEHLAGCQYCRKGVADLAGLPGMFALVDTEAAVSMASGPTTNETPSAAKKSGAATPPESLLPRLAAKTRQQRRRGRLITVGAAIAAAAAAVAIAVPITTTVTGQQNRPAVEQVYAARTMDPLVPTPVSASFTLIEMANGKTKVEMSCSYAPSEMPYSAKFELWLNLKDGSSTEVVGWSARPGNELTLSGTTDVAPDRIRSVEIKSMRNNQAILSATI